MPSFCVATIISNTLLNLANQAHILCTNTSNTNPDLREYILTAPYFQPGPAALTASDVFLSPSVKAIVEMAPALSSDGTTKPPHLLAAMLLIPRCIGRHVLETLSDGAVTARSYASEILSRLKLKMTVTQQLQAKASAARKQHREQPWSSGVIRGGAVKPVAASPPFLLPRCPEVSDAGAMRGPTPNSNWLIKGSVLTGQEPQSVSEVNTILAKARVDTFVSFTENGCVGGDSWGGKNYLQSWIDSGAPATMTRMVNWVNFPIVDFEVSRGTEREGMMDRERKAKRGGGQDGWIDG